MDYAGPSQVAMTTSAAPVSGGIGPALIVAGQPGAALYEVTWQAYVDGGGVLPADEDNLKLIVGVFGNPAGSVSLQVNMAVGAVAATPPVTYGRIVAVPFPVGSQAFIELVTRAAGTGTYHLQLIATPLRSDSYA